jgi:hypothetical protein
MNELQKLKIQIMSFIESKLQEADLWDLIKNFRDKKNVNVTWVTPYNAVKNFKISRPALTKASNEGLVRVNEEKLIAREDLELYMTLRDFFKELEDGNIINTQKIKDKNQYLILDTFKWNKTLPEYQTEILAKVLEGFAKNALDIDLSQLIKEKLGKK